MRKREGEREIARLIGRLDEDGEEDDEERDAESQSSSGKSLVDEVAKRLKQAEARVLNAERSSRELELEASRLRAALSQVHVAFEQETRQRRETELRAREVVERLRTQVKEKEVERCALEKTLHKAKAELARMSEEQTSRTQELTEERARLDSQVQAQRTQLEQLKEQLTALQNELEHERKLSARKLQEVFQNLDAESLHLGDVNTKLRMVKTEKEGVEQELRLVNQQKHELQQLVAAARQAESEARESAVQLEARLKRSELVREQVELDKRQLVNKVAQLHRAIEDDKAERDELERNFHRLKSENNDLEQQLERLADNKSYYHEQIEGLRRQAEEAKEAARRTAERIRSTETKLRQEHQSQVSKYEHENQLLRMDVERLQRELRVSQAANRTSEGSARAARQELERLSKAMSSGAVASESMARELEEKKHLENKVRALENELATIRTSTRASALRSQKLKSELDAKHREAVLLNRQIKDLEARLEQSLRENEELIQRHRKALKVKDEENSYVWTKLEQALKL